MKCPVFTVGGYDNDDLPRFGWNDCLQEGCAWWDESKNCCLVKVIGKELTLIQLKLSDMIRQMPHERSFVK